MSCRGGLGCVGMGSMASDFSNCIDMGYDMGTCAGVAVAASGSSSTSSTSWLLPVGIGFVLLLLILPGSKKR